MILRRLLSEAGFSAVNVQSHAIPLHFPSAEEFVGIIAAGASTMLRALGAVSGSTRRAVLEDVAAALLPFSHANGLSFPLHGLIAIGSGQIS